jgi:hypothetical protein
MRSWVGITLLAALPGFAGPAFAAPARSGVQVIPDEAHRRVDITIDGKPFTSYIWPGTLKKPTLYPLTTDEGITVTRGFPLNSNPGERVDHPHQVGMWFNYGNVNGFDFWNNSDAIKPEQRTKMGTILQSKVLSTKSGGDRGELVVESTWVSGEGTPLIDEVTRYVFTYRNHLRVIDQTITLKPLERVVFKDDKEGLFGIRVAKWLESPDEKGGEFMDSSGRPTKVDGASDGASGVYETSEGVKSAAAWSTRGRWCELTGNTGGHAATIAILDYSKNPDYPTYWHARGYGLFAANPLGRSIFDPRQPPLNFAAEKGSSVTFRYRVLIASTALAPQDVNREADAFEAEIK